MNKEIDVKKTIIHASALMRKKCVQYVLIDYKRLELVLEFAKQQYHAFDQLKVREV